MIQFTGYTLLGLAILIATIIFIYIKFKSLLAPAVKTSTFVPALPYEGGAKHLFQGTNLENYYTKGDKKLLIFPNSGDFPYAGDYQ